MVDEMKMNKKVVLKEIEESLRNGRSKKDIFEELSRTYPEEKRVVTILGTFPTYERKERYKLLNTALFSLVLLTGIEKMLSFFTLPVASIPFAWLLIFILPVLNVCVAVGVWKTRSYIYTLIGALALGGIAKVGQSGGGIVDMAFLGVMSILSFYISRKMFPDQGLFGPKKTPSGKYLMFQKVISSDNSKVDTGLKPRTKLSAVEIILLLISGIAFSVYALALFLSGIELISNFK
jgi:hypothetical protein